MSVEHIEELDTLNQGRLKINAILDQSNASAEKVDAYQVQLTNGISEAKNIADEAGKEAVQIATDAGNQANETANQAMNNAKTAITIAGNAVSTANNNKQEFDTLRNDFDQLVAEAGDSNPEIVQARTDTQGIKQATLANRLQIDLETRGPGDFFGSRQHGLPTLRIADLMADSRALYAAQKEALALVGADPALRSPGNAGLRRLAEELFSGDTALN